MDPGTLLVAEQAISTTVEGAALASIGLAQKTQPLSATFKRITNGAFLPRSFHTLTIVSERAYILGGKTENGSLAGDEVHIITLPSKRSEEGETDYKCVPALGEEGAEKEVPIARAGHSTCAIGERIYMFGGYGEAGVPLDEQGRIWVFSINSLRWSYIDPTSGNRFPEPRFSYGLAANEYPLPPGSDGKLKILGAQIQETVSKTLPKIVSKPSPPAEPHGTLFISNGLSSTTSGPLTDVWAFTVASQTWSQLPSTSPELVYPPSITLANGHLYLVNGLSEVNSEIHSLSVWNLLHPGQHTEYETEDLDKSSSWRTLAFPTNPLVPGPRPRKGAGLLPITTGNGRAYLLYFLGEKANPSNPPESTRDQAQEKSPMFWSDAFSYQPSATAVTPASVKDSTRAAIGIGTGEGTWAEVKVIANEEGSGKDQAEGKSHPGPRGWFGSDVVQSGDVLLWGGIDARGNTEGDGWIISVK